jgi:molybdopterin-binding protein
LILVRLDGTERRVPLTGLIDIYEGSVGTHIQVGVDANNVISATIRAGSITSSELNAALNTTLGRVPVIGGSAGTFWEGSGTWVNFGTTVRGTALTGLTTVTASAIEATDTVLQALQKLQAQVTSHGTSMGSDIAATVREIVLTGLSTTTNATITATDSILAALGKLQAQLNSATNANTANTIVKRDTSGNFSAGAITTSVAATTTASTHFIIQTGTDNVYN